VTFAWQGFRFDHPDDWAPTGVSGSFPEGYARLSSSGRIAVQLRWKKSGAAPDLQKLIARYESKLRREARRLGDAFSLQSSPRDSETEYHWSGAGQGRGTAFYSELSKRVFILEVMGSRSDQLLPTLRSIVASFRDPVEALSLWSVLGLVVRIPADASLSKHVFQAGKTKLAFTGRGYSLECIRWGFAEQILGRYSLDDWSRAAVGMPGAEALTEGPGIRLSNHNFLARQETLVALQMEGNQIVTVKSIYRGASGKPTWEWLP